MISVADGMVVPLREVVPAVAVVAAVAAVAGISAFETVAAAAASLPIEPSSPHAATAARHEAATAALSMLFVCSIARLLMMLKAFSECRRLRVCFVRVMRADRELSVCGYNLFLTFGRVCQCTRTHIDKLLRNSVRYRTDAAVPYAYSIRELQVINDDVMGGQSRSKLLRTAKGLLFEGDVSLANDGGFASFRAPLRIPPDVAALQVALRGAPQYQAPFVAPHARTTLRFEPPERFITDFNGFIGAG
jgi:hypothetical protein